MRPARDLLAAWRRRRPGWPRRAWARHPRWAMALRTALAAGLAWIAGQAVPDPLGDYPYYAPMGATVATSLSLAGSVRESVQAVGSIALGALIAMGVDLVGDPNAVGVAVAVGLGVLVAGWRPLGSMGSWVITGALFSLLFGHRDPEGFAGAYAGLTAMGAAIGIGVNAVFPPVPLAPAQESMMRLRATLVEQLEALSDALDGDRPPDAEEWAERQRTLEPLIVEMRATVDDAREAARANRRARRYADALRGHQEQFRALERVARHVEDLTDLLSTTERADAQHVALGPELRPPAARALAELGRVLTTVEGGVAAPDAHESARDALEDLVEEMQRVRTHYPDDAFLAASSVAATVRRSLQAVAPAG